VFRNLGLTLILVSCILLNGCEDRTNPMMDVVIPSLVDEPETDAAPSEEPVLELPVSLDIPDVEEAVLQHTDELYFELRQEDIPLYKTADDALTAEHTVKYFNSLQDWLSTICLEHSNETVHTYNSLRMYFTSDKERNKFISVLKQQENFWDIRPSQQGLFHNNLYYPYYVLKITPIPFSCN